MKLTNNSVKAFRPVKYFKENLGKINSLSYSDNGEAIISSSDDDQMIVYDCISGTPQRTINSKKYGVNLIQFTHSPSAAIHASTKIDDTIRYLSLNDNKYIRYFQSHTKRVVCLCMSPIDDTFLSSSLDGTVRLWDLRSQNCHGVMHVPGRPIASFDPDGLIFAAGINSECLKLYDLRSFDKGPFATFKLATVGATGIVWESLKFSPDGKSILICTNGDFIYLVDAYSGLHINTLTVGNNTEKQTLDACFSPNSHFIICTAPDALLQVWVAEAGSRLTALPSYESTTQMTGPLAQLNCVSFNPRFAMLATGSHQTCFWLANIDDE